MSRFRINALKKSLSAPSNVPPDPAPTLADSIHDEGHLRTLSHKRARPLDMGGVSERKCNDADDNDDHDNVAMDNRAELEAETDVHAIVPFGMSVEDQANAPYVNGPSLTPMARPVAETKHGMRQFIVSQHGVRMFIQYVANECSTLF